MTQTEFAGKKTEEEPRERMWFMRSGEGQHTVCFCLKCKCQRTFSSIAWRLFKCDSCGTKMRYNEYEGRMILD